MERGFIREDTRAPPLDRAPLQGKLVRSGEGYGSELSTRQTGVAGRPTLRPTEGLSMLGTAENWRHASTPQPQAGLSLCDARETGEETTRGVCPGGKVFGGKMYGPAR